MSSLSDNRQDDSSGTGTDRRWREWLGVAWFTMLFVASIGVHNGDSNQNSYLLLGLRLADPAFLPGDWFTWETVHSHQVYGLFVALVARLGLLNLGLALGVLVQNALFALGVYVILRVLYDRPLVPWAASLVVFSAMDTMSLGAAPWLKPFLGVSTMSSVAMVLGLLFLARGRLVVAGLALGLSALFHAHFLVLSLPIMVAVSVERLFVASGVRPWRTITSCWIAFFVVAAPSLIQIIRFMAAPGVHEIHWLTVSLFPYHVAPWTWWRNPVLVLIGAVFFGAGGMMLRPPRSNRALAFAGAAIALSVFLSFALAYRQTLELASQTWPWRLSPLVLIGGIALGMAAWTSPSRWTPVRGIARWAGLASLVLGFLVILKFSKPPASHLVLFSVSIPGLLGVGAFWRGRSWSRTGCPRFVAAVLVTAGFVPLAAEGLKGSHLEIRSEVPERSVLYDWIRSTTPETAIFAVPPSWEGFRINARRPMVVDWKAVPRYAPDRIEWLERMRALTGIREPGDERRVLDEGFGRMDCDRVQLLRQRYGVRYVVHERPQQLECGELVYEDDSYCVWDLSAGQVSAGEPRSTDARPEGPGS